MKHVISHHNSGLLLQIQQSAWPGLREHSDSYQTGDGWHTTTTLTVSPFSLPFMSAWTRTRTHTQSKASDACYRWQTTEPVDVGHAAVCLLGLLTTMQQFKQNCDCCYNQPPTRLRFIWGGGSILQRVPVPVLLMQGSELIIPFMNSNKFSVFMMPAELQTLRRVANHWKKPLFGF